MDKEFELENGEAMPDEKPMSAKGKKQIHEILGLKEDPTGVKLSPNSIDLNEIDREIYHDCVDRYPAMADNLEAGLQEYAPFDHLSEDIFNSLFKYNVNLKDEEEMMAKSQLNRKLMEQILESEEYQKLRKHTQFDLLASAIGTEVLQTEAIKKIMQYKQAYLQKKQTGQHVDGADAGELIETLNKMSQIQSQIDALEALAGPGGPGLTKKQAMELAKLKQDWNDVVEEYEQNYIGQQQFQQGMQQTAQQATKSATVQVGEVQDIIEAWGLGEGSHNRKISLEERRKAIERVRRSRRLRDLTDLIGRFRALAMRKKKKRIPDGHDIKTVELGNKLENIMPSELAKLTHPVMKKDFMRRYHQKQLMVYKKEDNKTVGRGPIIVCHDKSGSMAGIKDDWSTALTLATLEIAQKEKRNFAYIPYEDKVLQTKDIRAGELDPQDVLDIAEMNADGGTNFMMPLERALKCLEDSLYKKGDILFITDGQAAVSPEFLNRFKKVKEEKQFFVTTVLINIDGWASRGGVEPFSDSITTISSVADLDEANAEKIFNIIKDKDKFDPQPQPQSNNGSAVAQVVQNAQSDAMIDSGDDLWEDAGY